MSYTKVKPGDIILTTNGCCYLYLGRYMRNHIEGHLYVLLPVNRDTLVYDTVDKIVERVKEIDRAHANGFIRYVKRSIPYRHFLRHIDQEIHLPAIESLYGLVHIDDRRRKDLRKES